MKQSECIVFSFVRAFISDNWSIDLRLKRLSRNCSRRFSRRCVQKSMIRSTRTSLRLRQGSTRKDYVPESDYDVTTSAWCTLSYLNKWPSPSRTCKATGAR